MAGTSKLRHLRFHDERWEAFCATLPPGKSPTALLEELMDAHIAQPPQMVEVPRRLCAPRPQPPLNATEPPDPYPRAPRPWEHL